MALLIVVEDGAETGVPITTKETSILSVLGSYKVSAKTKRGQH